MFIVLGHVGAGENIRDEDGVEYGKGYDKLAKAFRSDKDRNNARGLISQTA